MKAFLALAGVGIFGAAVYFIAKRRNALPNVGSTQASGNLSTPKQKTSTRQIAANLITSENLAAVGGLLDGVFGRSGGGAATPTAPGWQKEGGLVVSL